MNKRTTIEHDGLLDWSWAVEWYDGNDFRIAHGRTFRFKTAYRRIIYWEGVAARAAIRNLLEVDAT